MQICIFQQIWTDLIQNILPAQSDYPRAFLSSSENIHISSDLVLNTVFCGRHLIFSCKFESEELGNKAQVVDVASFSPSGLEMAKKCSN